MGAASRNKGSAAEREVARLLEDELGIKFARDLEQCRSGGSDLVPSDPAFPFVIEVKRRAAGWTYTGGWWEQVCNAAIGTGKRPALFYRFDRQLWRCVIPITAVAEAVGGEAELALDECEVCIPVFCMIAREMMARRARDTGGTA